MTRAPASARRQLHIGAATACSNETTNKPESANAMVKCSVCESFGGPCYGRIGEDPVLLDARLGLVLLVDILERGFPQQLAWQDHNTNKPAGPIGGSLREDGSGPA